MMAVASALKSNRAETHSPLSAETSYKPPPCQSPTSETAEAYPRVVAVLDAKRRVIECPAAIQWIVQIRRRSGPNPWQSESFCRTKAALLHIAGQHPALIALPDHFRRRTSMPLFEIQTLDGRTFEIEGPNQTGAIGG
jgi:hypothetical protein